MNKLYIEYCETNKKYYLYRIVIRCGKKVKQRLYVSYDKARCLVYKEYLVKRHEGVLPEQIEHKKEMIEKEKAKQKIRKENKKYLEEHTIQYDGATANMKDIYNAYYESLDVM